MTTAIGEAVNKAIQLSRLSQESILADRATLLLQTDSNVPDKDWVVEQTLNTKIALEVRNVRNTMVMLLG